MTITTATKEVKKMNMADPYMLFIKDLLIKGATIYDSNGQLKFETENGACFIDTKQVSCGPKDDELRAIVMLACAGAKVTYDIEKMHSIVRFKNGDIFTMSQNNDDDKFTLRKIDSIRIIDREFAYYFKNYYTLFAENGNNIVQDFSLGAIVDFAVRYKIYCKKVA